MEKYKVEIKIDNKEINKTIDIINNDLSKMGYNNIKAELVSSYGVITKIKEVNFFGEIITKRDIICKDIEFYILLTREDRYIGHIRFAELNHIIRHTSILEYICCKPEDVILLDSFVIISTYRNNNIGKAVLSNIEKYLSRRYKYIIGKSATERANKFYINNGYTIVPITHCPYVHDFYKELK